MPNTVNHLTPNANRDMYSSDGGWKLFNWYSLTLLLSFSQCLSIDETAHCSIIASGTICSLMSIGVNFIKLKASMFSPHVFTMLSF